MTQVIRKMNIDKISKKNYAINGVPGFTPVLRNEEHGTTFPRHRFAGASFSPRVTGLRFTM